MRPRCPRCGGPPSYEEGGNYVCMMGGHRWPFNGTKPIVIYKRSEEEEMEGTKPTSGKKGKCVNCERDKFIADKEGLCSSCHNAVKGISKDSGAYAIALADVKKRLINNPSRRCTVARAKAMAAAPVKRVKPEAVAVAPIEYKSLAERNLVNEILDKLIIQRDYHLEQAGKFKQAIVLLS